MLLSKDRAYLEDVLLRQHYDGLRDDVSPWVKGAAKALLEGKAGFDGFDPAPFLADIPPEPMEGRLPYANCSWRRYYARILDINVYYLLSSALLAVFPDLAGGMVCGNSLCPVGDFVYAAFGAAAAALHRLDAGEGGLRAETADGGREKSCRSSWLTAGFTAFSRSGWDTGLSQYTIITGCTLLEGLPGGVPDGVGL